MTYYENLSSDEAVRLETLKLTANMFDSGNMDGWLANAKRAADHVLGEPQRTWYEEQATKAHATIRAHLDAIPAATRPTEVAVPIEGLHQILNALANFIPGEPPF